MPLNRSRAKFPPCTGGKASSDPMVTFSFETVNSVRAGRQVRLLFVFNAAE